MLGALQSLYDGFAYAISMRAVEGVTGDSRGPSMGLRQPCHISATLFGLFLDGLHHHLETAVPMAGIQVLQMRPRELVYADDICFLASLPEQLQALIDSLAAYCAALGMETSVPETKVMIVSTVPAPAVTFTSSGNPVDQVATFKYLGLHSHRSGSIAQFVTPIKLRAVNSWAAAQQCHSLLQCGNTINLHLQLLQSYPSACLTTLVSDFGYTHISLVLVLLVVLALHCNICQNVCLSQNYLPSFTVYSSQAPADRDRPRAFASVLVATNIAILE